MYHEERVYDLEYHLLANYRDFSFYIIDSLKLSQVDNADQFQATNTNVSDNRNECGVHFVRNDEHCNNPLLVLVYYRYNPFPVVVGETNSDNFAYTSALRRNITHLINEHGVKASALIKEQLDGSSSRHCLNFVIKINKQLQISAEHEFECQNENVEARTEVRVVSDSDRHGQYCAVAQYYKGPILSKNTIISTKRFSVEYLTTEISLSSKNSSSYSTIIGQTVKSMSGYVMEKNKSIKCELVENLSSSRMSFNCGRKREIFESFMSFFFYTFCKFWIFNFMN